jgi:hypothetical protein
MTKDDFAKLLLDTIHPAEIQVRADGQAEYSHDDSNAFANFDRVADRLHLTREQVLLVYAEKHWDGIISYVNGHKSQREDVRGRLKDLRMYLALLWGMVEESNPSSDRNSGEEGIGSKEIPISLSGALTTPICSVGG